MRYLASPRASGPDRWVKKIGIEFSGLANIGVEGATTFIVANRPLIAKAFAERIKRNVVMAQLIEMFDHAAGLAVIPNIGENSAD